MTVVHWICYFVTVSFAIAYENLSYQKMATQSTTVIPPPNDPDKYLAGNAVDRNFSTCMRTEAIGGNSPYKTVWWKMDLGGVYNIYSVNILFKNYDGYETRQRGRFAGFSLHVSNNNEIDGDSLCYKDGPELPSLNFTRACARSGRYIIIYNDRLTSGGYPSGYQLANVFTELCEVFVYGCMKNGVYGNNCDMSCPINCKTNTCQIQDGSCFECKPGWNGAKCDTECAYGWYGAGCKQQCSEHCRNNVSCNRSTGLCNEGCAPGWNGSFCNKINKLPNMDLSEDASNGPLVGGVVGSIIALLLVVVIVLVLWFKRRKTGIPKNDPRLIHTNEKELAVAFSSKNDRAEHVKKKTINKSKNGLPGPIKKSPLININVSVKNIKAHTVAMSADDNAGFKDEYNSIERGELYPCLEAKKPANNAKNRYTGMYPYDHSRVVLKNSQDGNDYINANYIENTRGKRYYIATQAPKKKTITDFWTMVWEREVSTIVCLTNIKEGNKNKCVQYWPNINEKLQAGEITVRHVGEKTYVEHSVRRFKIYHNTKTQNRDVMMYHYTAWADRGVTDPLSLVVFHRQVMRATTQSTGKYTLVHCSAGIGRTGTYIALDVLYREGERFGEVNVPMFVKTMRKDRINMVQTEDQYKVLYLALMEAFGGPPKTMTTEMFISQHQGQNNGDTIGDMTLSTEFEELLALRKEYTQDVFASGLKYISANYTPSVLPVEHYMCSLPNPKGHKSYYNAVHIQTFLDKDCVISAQYPLPSYIEDFLRLVRDFNIQMVVFFGPIKDIKSSSTWFPTKNQSKLLGNFTLKHVSSTHTPNITNNKLILQSQGLGDLEITVLECPTWRDGQLTENKRILLDIIKEVKTEKNNQEGQILVLSSDGATSCGAFCVVYNALEQIKVDGEVDIFTIARQLQVRRPEFLSTWAEYQLCYAAVAEYLLNDFVYGN
ncbi:receptor-type tyrosine-protein phosphatase alpha-like isoform X2 [Crassostrea virginica]